MKKVLHAGSGPFNSKKLHSTFQSEHWQEIRLDINHSYSPDIIGDIRNMPEIASNSMDAVYSSHNIEHLYTHEVDKALCEFLRVLVPGGFLLLTCPDLQELGKHITDGDLHKTLYVSPAGPIAPIDIIFGHRPSLACGNLFMSHKTGFTAQTLSKALTESGFVKVEIKREPSKFELWAMAYKMS